MILDRYNFSFNCSNKCTDKFSPAVKEKILQDFNKLRKKYSGCLFVWTYFKRGSYGGKAIIRPMLKLHVFGLMQKINEKLCRY